MLAGLVIVPLVSLVTKRPDPHLVNATFACYEERVMVRRTQALEENL